MEGGNEAPAGLCWGCDYPLHGIESRRCPECGREFDPANSESVNTGRPMGALWRWAVRPVGWWVLLVAALGTGLMAWVSRVPVHGVSGWFADWNDSLRLEDWGKGWEEGAWREVIYTLGVLVWLVVLVAWWGGAVVRSVGLLRCPVGVPHRRGVVRYVAMWLMLVLAVMIVGVGWPYRMGEAMAARELWAEKHTKSWVGTPSWTLSQTGYERTALWEVALRGAEARERLAAFRMLIENMPSSAGEVLADALARERDPAMKVWEVRLLGIYGGRDACARVGKYLDDADAAVRTAAVDAMGLLFGADGNGELRESSPTYAWPTTVSDPPIGLRELPEARDRAIAHPQSNIPMAEMPEPWRSRLQKMMVEGATAGERLAAARVAARYGPPGYRLRVAEWGVWCLGEGAEGGKLDAVLEDLPKFVHATGDDLAQLLRQANATAGLRRVPNPSMLITKPVVHLTANLPLSVELHAGFQYGRPWYAYPVPDGYTAAPYSAAYVAGELSPGDLGALGTKLSPGYEWLVPSRPPIVSSDWRLGSLNGLCWQNLIVSPTKLGWMKPAEGGAEPNLAWWRGLRDVACSWVSNREESERFVYYDGPTALRCPVRFVWEGGRLMVSPARLSRTDLTFLQVPPMEYEKTRSGLLVQVVKGRATGQWVTIPLTLNSIDRMVPRVLPRTEVRGTAEGAFSSKLTERGLTYSEQRGMLDSWRHDFFEREGVRLLMFLSARDYERFCPMTVKPAATEVVRVGVIWVEL